MSDTVTKDTLFPPARMTPATRAELTDRAARAIIEAEAKRREAKTKRLRQARLEMEARRAEEAAPAKTKTAKAKARNAS